MTRTKSPLEAAAGKLISAIQKEWFDEIGESSADESEQVMHTSHGLLHGAKTGSIAGVLGGGSVPEFLGSKWVAAHPNVWPFIKALEGEALRGIPGDGGHGHGHDSI